MNLSCKLAAMLGWAIAAAYAQPPSDLQTLFDSIKAQEANFPLPSTTATITAGTLDLTNIDNGKPVFSFAIPTYQDGSYYTIYRPISPEEQKDFPNHQTAIAIHIMNQGAQVSVANILHLNLRFEIKPGGAHWSAQAEAS